MPHWSSVTIFCGIRFHAPLCTSLGAREMRGLLAYLGIIIPWEIHVFSAAKRSKKYDIATVCLEIGHWKTTTFFYSYTKRDVGLSENIWKCGVFGTPVISSRSIGQCDPVRSIWSICWAPPAKSICSHLSILKDFNRAVREKKRWSRYSHEIAEVISNDCGLHLSICLSVYLSIYLSLRPSVPPSIHPSPKNHNTSFIIAYVISH